jgi:hypothetical protein
MMSGWVANGLIACFLLAAIMGLVDASTHRSWSRLFGYLLVIGCAGVVLNLTTGFPYAGDRKPFGGGSSPLVAVGLMFISVLLGIGATYIFNLTERFSWRDFARPMVVSPLILLPLIGSLQGAELEPVQLVCFAVLAFQNGFFWQQVLRDAKPAT